METQTRGIGGVGFFFCHKPLETLFGFTFLEGLVNTSLPLSKAFISFNIRENSALVYPIVVMGTKEKYWEVPDIMFEALYVERHRPGIADLCWPPPAKQQKEKEVKKHSPSLG